MILCDHRGHCRVQTCISSQKDPLMSLQNPIYIAHVSMVIKGSVCHLYAEGMVSQQWVQPPCMGCFIDGKTYRWTSRCVHVQGFRPRSLLRLLSGKSAAEEGPTYTPLPIC